MGSFLVYFYIPLQLSKKPSLSISWGLGIHHFCSSSRSDRQNTSSKIWLSGKHRQYCVTFINKLFLFLSPNLSGYLIFISETWPLYHYDMVQLKCSNVSCAIEFRRTDYPNRQVSQGY